MRRLVSLTACLLAVMAIALEATAYGGLCRARARCGGCTDPCATYVACAPAPCVVAKPVYVEKTIMVPTWVTETRDVMVTEYEQAVEQRRIPIEPEQVVFDEGMRPERRHQLMRILTDSGFLSQAVELAFEPAS